VSGGHGRLSGTPEVGDAVSKKPELDNLNLFFGFLMAGMTGYFLLWGYGYTNGTHLPLFGLATAFGLFMAFNIGGNDVANSFGTSVGAGTLTMRQALVVAAIFEVSGAVIAGGEVTNTIRGGIVSMEGLGNDPNEFMYIMMAALLAAALWLLFACKRGYPVSTTHSIIGGIVGSAITLGLILDGGNAFSLVNWRQIGTIALSWVISPVLGGLASYLLFATIRKHILEYNEEAERKLEEIREEIRAHKEAQLKSLANLDAERKAAIAEMLARDVIEHSDRDFNITGLKSEFFRELEMLKEKENALNAHKAIEYWVPLVAAFGAMIIAAMLLFKGLNNLNLQLTDISKMLIMGMVAAAVWIGALIVAKTMHREALGKTTIQLFSWMQVFTACGFAFSHGSNDIANAVGPFAAILDVLRTGELASRAAIPTVTMVAFGVAMIAGLWFIGRKVIMTVGHHLTSLHPASGFSAELSASAVVLMASLLGIPVSSTHILIGSVLGIGLVNRETNWGLMKPIALAWIITLPAAALLSALFFLILRWIF
jgi:PiT family inorganic phosphate transporter